jgi:alkylated DNA repair dioxygenase AlkB
MTISGLIYRAEYITADEEAQLLAAIDAGIWLTDLKRRVQHYGYLYDYRKRNVDVSMKLGALPEWGQQLAARFYADGLIAYEADQIIVNEYQPGQGIAPHVDCEPCFHDTIISLSLGSGCVMEFTALADNRVMPMWLAGRGVLVMQREARYDWKHETWHSGA